MSKGPIGVFDSGVGGLTVVREIVRLLPQEEILYIGDTARVPWGTRGKQTITAFSHQLANFLVRKKAKVIVVACHTASSVALPSLKKKIKAPLIDVIQPSAQKAVEETENHRIGLIGTPATIESGAWQRAIKKINPAIKVFVNPCPLFVPLVEEGLTRHPVTKIIVKEYIVPLLEKKVDTLILACTHYPLLEGVIKKTAGEVKLVNPGKATALFLKEFLQTHQLKKRVGKGQYQFFFTDLSHQTVKNLERFVGKLKGVKIEEVSLKE